MKQDIISMLDGKGSKKDSNSNPCIEIASLLFKAINDAHITHLLQPDKTLALHLALEKFYDGDVEDYVDTIVETCMGLYPVKNITVQASTKIVDCVEYFTDLYDEIENLRKGIKESFIQGQIDTIQQEIAHTLYRLKNITE